MTDEEKIDALRLTLVKIRNATTGDIYKDNIRSGLQLIAEDALNAIFPYTDWEVTSTARPSTGRE